MMGQAMARVVDVAAREEIQKLCRKLFQSGNINFLLGSGASHPAIPVVGTIEQEIVQLFEAGQFNKANAKMYEFLVLVQEPMNTVIKKSTTDAIEGVLAHYKEYLRIIERILSERRTELLPKQANVFTTNYDLFLEKASEASVTLKLNDGFSRVPSLEGRTRYSAQGFFESVSTRGPMYSYKVELPCVNLIKLHGSLSWIKEAEEVLFGVAEKALLDGAQLKDPGKVAEFVQSYAIVLPERAKFQETLMNQVHYDLMRLFANQMDKAHTVLVAFGFSFGDGHIYHVMQRALSNPTLVMLVFAYDDAAVEELASKFIRYNNVYIIKPATGEQIDFSVFNDTLKDVLPHEIKT